MSDPAERLRKNLPVPYTDSLPDEIRRNVGRWVDRTFHGSGTIEHVSETGDRLFTVKVGATPNTRFSTNTLRKFADIADRHGVGALRFTRSGNIEFIARSLEKAREIEGAAKGLGYSTGGWGRTLWCVNSCTAYLTCTTAVTDAPSMTKVLYDELKPYFTGEATLPAKLRINVAGCASGCGGLVADIVITGHYSDAPTYDPERIRSCLPLRADFLDTATPELVMVCPTSAIKAHKTPDNRVGIDIIRDKCIGCGRCRDVCDFITWDTKKIGVSVMVGGKSSNTGVGPTLARMLVPWVPVTPPGYREVVAVAGKIIETWRAGARQGERMADYLERVGMEALLQALEVPVTKHNRPSRIGPGFGLRQFRGGQV